MTYSPSYHQPSLLELARQGNFRAIAYWINSIFAPKGIYIQADTGRSGCLVMMVNFPRQTSPQACARARQQLVRHICYRLWTLNSKAIRDVRIVARVTGQRDVIWRQMVRINTPANAAQGLRRKVSPGPARSRSRQTKHQRFQLLRSFLLNRLAIVGFLLCYWVIYLETTGHESADKQPMATIPQEQVQAAQAAKSQAKTAIVHPRPQPQNLVVTVPQQFRGQVVYETNPPANAEKVIALTFDDGPWKDSTDQVLSILKQNNIKATFFWVGQALQEYPEAAKHVVEQGHAVGNHTWRHIMDDMDTATAAEELGNTARLIYKTTGVRTALMRPPGGNLSGELVNYAKQQGFMATMWSADSQDYMVSAPLIVDNVLSNAKPGGIILLHDGGGDRSATVEALPQIITALRSQGYQFVTIPQLMELQAKWTAMQPPTSASGNNMIPAGSITSPASQPTGPSLADPVPNATPATEGSSTPPTPTSTESLTNPPAQPTTGQPLAPMTPSVNSPLTAAPPEAPPSIEAPVPSSPDPQLQPGLAAPEVQPTHPQRPSPLMQTTGELPKDTGTAVSYAPRSSG